MFIKNKIVPILLIVILLVSFSACGESKGITAEERVEKVDKVTEDDNGPDIDTDAESEEPDNEEMPDETTDSEVETEEAVKDEEVKDDVTKEASSTKENKQIKKKGIVAVFTEKLEENIYPNGDMPMFSVYDFNGDSVYELLIWEERLCTANNRIINVFMYDEESDTAKKIGELVDFEGHSNVAESSDYNGVVIGIRDSGEDTITKYYYINGKIDSKVLLERTDEDSEEWLDLMYSEDYCANTIKCYDETAVLTDLLG